MTDLAALPTEIFDLIIEHLVIAIGIQKAVFLRTVSQAFDAALLNAICIRQIIVIDDSCTSSLVHRMGSPLKGKIVAVKSLSTSTASKNYLSVVAKVNQTLDILIGETCQGTRNSRHELIAGVVRVEDTPITVEVEAQNLLSGAALVGSLAIFRSLLARRDSNINGQTPYFDSALVLAAAQGSLEVVLYLLECGARLDSVVSHWIVPTRLTEQADWINGDVTTRFSALSQSRSSALRTAVLCE